jgi:hypothetical protein
MVHVGVHPCFVGPSATRPNGLGTVEVGSGYLEQGWSPTGDPAGIRARVGTNHLPLSSLLDALIGAGLQIDRVEESRDVDPPVLLGIQATKRAA